jgi:Lauroyl/myristoyl acyltransferase
MEKALYLLLNTFIRIIALLPMRCLYVISDILYPITYYIVKYRRKVVRQNLTESFPEKSDKEVIELEKRFYHHFCDYIVESVKQAGITQQEVLNRAHITNMEVMNEWEKKGRSAVIMLGHYGNWEWFSSINYRLETTQFGQVYRQLKSPMMDKLFLQIRSVYGALSIEKKKTMREILMLKKQKKQVLIAFLSDQSPSRNNLIYWTNFLNHETSILVGAERIAQKADFDVFYFDIRKIGRGKYEAEIKVITEIPAETKEFEITEKYARLMEETILRDPAYWLWTHKRWKHKRED